MGDRREKARRLGDVPDSSVLRAVLVGLGGLVGAVVAVWSVPWRAWIADSVSPMSTPQSVGILGLDIALRVILATTVFALLGLLLAQILMGPLSLRLRRRLEGPGSKGAVWARFGGRLSALLAVSATPFVVAGLAEGRGGWAVAYSPIVALGLGLLFCVPLAAVHRAWAVGRWRDRVDPDPPPRRDEDGRAPEVEAALKAALRAPPSGP